MRHLIAIVDAQFLPGADIADGHNPQGVICFCHGTVRITGMVDIPGWIVQGLAVDRRAVIQMKDVGIALLSAASALV